MEITYRNPPPSIVIHLSEEEALILKHFLEAHVEVRALTQKDYELHQSLLTALANTLW